MMHRQIIPWASSEGAVEAEGGLPRANCQSIKVPEMFKVLETSMRNPPISLTDVYMMKPGLATAT